MASSLTININWEYLLGLLGSLLALAWYGSARFSRTETLITAMEERLTTLEGMVRGMFHSASPITLTRKGRQVLRDTGLKNYIDTHEMILVARVRAGGTRNAYDLQRAAFLLVDSLQFERRLDDRLKRVAFREGVDTRIARRVGGIYLRNLLLGQLSGETSDRNRKQGNQPRSRLHSPRGKP